MTFQILLGDIIVNGVALVAVVVVIILTGMVVQEQLTRRRRRQGRDRQAERSRKSPNIAQTQNPVDG
jgi:small-conductance mechanosensitive channel